MGEAVDVVSILLIGMFERAENEVTPILTDLSLSHFSVKSLGDQRSTEFNTTPFVDLQEKNRGSADSRL
jgi:hypothetical protein